MEKKKVIVTGANGQLGRELQALAATFPAFDHLLTDRKDLPIEDPGRVTAFFKEARPAFCINCAAYTAVDKAETEKDLAFAINGEAVGSLAVDGEGQVFFCLRLDDGGVSGA